MGLNVDVRVIQQPGATGQQTYDLPANFDLKALRLFTAALSTDGAAIGTTGDLLKLSRGAATYRGGVVQQWYNTIAAEGGLQAAAHYANGIGTDACLKSYNSSIDVTTPNVFLHVDLVSFSMQGGSSSYDRYTLDWVGLADSDPNAVIVVVAYGGSDITDALAHSWATAAAATQDITLATGFQPDLLLLEYASCPAGDYGGTSVNAHPHEAEGWAVSDTVRRCALLGAQDGAADMNVYSWQKARAIMGVTSAGAAECEGDLAARASWPANGYRIAWADQPVAGDLVVGLALKGTFQVALGAANVPTATGDQDIAAGFTPVAAMLWGTHMPASTAIRTADSGTALLGGITTGATDFTDEASAGFSEDDANATTTARVYQELDAAYCLYTAGTTTLKARADASVSGTNLRLNWTAVPAADPPELLYAILGAAPAGGDITDAATCTATAVQAAAEALQDQGTNGAATTQAGGEQLADTSTVTAAATQAAATEEVYWRLVGTATAVATTTGAEQLHDATPAVGAAVTAAVNEALADQASLTAVGAPTEVSEVFTGAALTVTATSTVTAAEQLQDAGQATATADTTGAPAVADSSTASSTTEHTHTEQLADQGTVPGLGLPAAASEQLHDAGTATAVGVVTYTSPPQEGTDAATAVGVAVVEAINQHLVDVGTAVSTGLPTAGEAFEDAATTAATGQAIGAEAYVDAATADASSVATSAEAWVDAATSVGTSAASATYVLGTFGDVTAVGVVTGVGQVTGIAWQARPRLTLTMVGRPTATVRKVAPEARVAYRSAFGVTSQ